MQPNNPDPQTAGASATAPQRPSTGFDYVWKTFQRWWRMQAIGTINQEDVISKRREESPLSARYLLMISMSAGIAILGLLLSSPAVVIGAMLLSPLMDPIMGVGFALAIGDYKWLRQSLKSLAIGTAFAVVFCALIVFFSPLQTVTSEIAARTRPNLFDLLVAIFSAVAGAYAMIRGREGTIVGVAIATALMPPLAVVGFGLATFNWTVFSGALFLFVTNLTAIALTATAMARIYGFSTSLSDKQTQMQTLFIFGAFVVLAIPLFLSLRQIVWETNATRQINSAVIQVFDGNARVSQMEPDYQSVPIKVTATVLTPTIIGDAELLAAREMSRQLGQNVDVSLTQVRVGSSAQAAEEAQLANARAQEEAALEQAEDIAARLALLAGVSEDEVTVDRDRRRAMVTSRPLEGATLAAYAELERRIDATVPEWDLRLVPPPLALPAVGFEQVESDVGTQYVLSAPGRRAVALVKWAQSRVGIPVRLSGPQGSVTLLQEALAADGIVAEVTIQGTGYGDVRVSWNTGGE